MVWVKNVFRLGRVWLAASVAAAFVLASAQAQAPETGRWRHAISLTGPPKYDPDFRYPDYVNPQAPKGGRVRLATSGTFDNFNPFISGVKGSLAAYLMTIYEPLLWVSLDEPTTEYGLLAEAVAFPDDYSAVSFRLRSEARWHDGQPVTADDVIFSFEAWKRLSPQWNRLLLKVQGVEKVSEREVRFTFNEKGDPALPLYVGQISILPRHWWQGVDASGKPRDIELTTLEPPLGSGPYAVKSFIAGRSVSYERVAGYWGQNVPIRVGTENLDQIQIEYFRDANVMFEAFRADLVDVRRESSIKSWVVGYDFAAVTDGRVIKESFDIARLGLVKAFVFNLRRAKFQDLRVRRALAMAYSFEDVNRNVFHSLLSRPGSYFPQTDFEAKGLLSEGERDLLKLLPDAPHPDSLALASSSDNPASSRTSLFNALELLKEAGFRLKDGRLLDAKGEQLTIEFVLDDASIEKVASAYGSQLAKLGIGIQIRVVDDVQYQNRMRTFDFDIAAHGWVQGHAPGSEQREYWTTESADQRGTNNLGGLKSPLVDALAEKLVLAPDRAGKVAAGRLLDRVLRASAIGIPILTEDKELVARWDRFARPAVMPRYGATAFPAIWWWDGARAQKTGGKNAGTKNAGAASR
jgi:microcin C transport system substrate-binding protein